MDDAKAKNLSLAIVLGFLLKYKKAMCRRRVMIVYKLSM